jgi:hypothetical protein
MAASTRILNPVIK